MKTHSGILLFMVIASLSGIIQIYILNGTIRTRIVSLPSWQYRCSPAVRHLRCPLFPLKLEILNNVVYAILWTQFNNESIPKRWKYISYLWCQTIRASECYVQNVVLCVCVCVWLLFVFFLFWAAFLYCCGKKGAKAWKIFGWSRCAHVFAHFGYKSFRCQIPVFFFFRL